MVMYTDNLEETRVQLHELMLEHRDLDQMIDRLHEAVYVDQLQLRRLKKRKLALKEQIEKLRSALIPDMDA